MEKLYSAHFSRSKSFFLHLSWCNLTLLTLWSNFKNCESRFCGFFFLCALCVNMHILLGCPIAFIFLSLALIRWYSSKHQHIPGCLSELLMEQRTDVSLLPHTYCTTYWCTVLQKSAIDLVLLPYEFACVLNSPPSCCRAAFNGPRSPIPSSARGQAQSFILCFIHCSISDFFSFSSPDTATVSSAPHGAIDRGQLCPFRSLWQRPAQWREPSLW